MKTTFVATAVAGALMASSFTFADQPGADWMTKQEVMQKLKANGYSQITKLEADDGHWEGEGTKNGKKMEFHVDSHSGALLKEEVDH